MDSTNSTASLQIAEPIRETAEPAPQGTPSTMEMPDHWTVVGKLAVRHLDRFISLEPKMLKGDNPEAIHDIRVASRRLQQLLDLIYSKPRLREIRRFRRKIRRCRRALGGVRNYDLLLKNVSQIRDPRKRLERF
jgi:CHAD domain-containing protein